MDVPPILTKKVGPLPVVAWVGVVAGAFVVYRVLRGGSGTSASPSTALQAAADGGASSSGGVSSGGTDTTGTSTPPGTNPVTTPTPPKITIPVTRAQWAANFRSRLDVHQLHLLNTGQMAALVKTLDASQAHALHMSNTAPLAMKAPTVSAAIQVPAPVVPAPTLVAA